MYFKEGDDLLIVASKGGHPKHPEWYLSLVANPDVTVQIKREKLLMRAVAATEEEKSRLWPQIVKEYKGYDEYQQNTSRNIPVVILKKQAG
jgi:deazaflavin-dependent oxidoreductase (nitroreductase family)